MTPAIAKFLTRTPAIARASAARPAADSVKAALAGVFGRIIDRRAGARMTVGVEVEIPLVTADGRAVTGRDNIIGLLAEQLGFTAVGWSDDDLPVAIRSPDGMVVICYEFAHTMLEFSLQPANDCLALRRLLMPLLEEVATILAPRGISFAFSGVHPQAWSRVAMPVSTSYHRALAHFLRSGSRPGIYRNFGAFIASIHTHLDADVISAPVLLRLFHLAGFVQALLLANSRMDTPDGGFVLARDAMLNLSAIGTLRPSAAPSQAHDFDGLIQAELGNRLFTAKRDDVIWTFTPVMLADLDQHPLVQATAVLMHGTMTRPIRLMPGDVSRYRGYAIAVPTAYGTVEIRGDCLQPADSLLASVALATGLAARSAEAIAFLLWAVGRSDPVSLRAQACASGWAMRAQGLAAPLDHICRGVLSIAASGLNARGAGETELIAPLYARLDARSNPAMSPIAKGDLSWRV